MLFRTILNEVVPKRIREYVALKVVDFFSSYFQSNFTFVIEEQWEFADNQTFRAAEVYLPTRLAGLSTSELLVGSSDLKNPAAEPKFGIPVNTKIIDEFEGIRLEWTLHSVETKKYCREKRFFSSGQISLSGLLNFVDGLWSSCGEEKIIIFTTNHKEKLDPTLLRPGRMDVHILMDNCTPFVFKKLVALYLKINEHVMFDPIEKLVLEVSATPAEVTQQLMANKDADIAFKGLLEFLETKKIKKEEDSKVEEAAPALV
ncbi:AAA-ATPase At1g43910-like [Brassica rapa]|uniref:AAA-ATPase At1g43910-like n=1 Tax=Brassica campestris TaxID=3711 RepID=UPI00142DA34B|nr:AAA-ATPase At1g43910-like [Brassica rapa]